MENLIASDNKYLVVGAGATGLSAARYLQKNGLNYAVFDTREDADIAAPFKKLDASTAVYLGAYPDALLAGVSRIILSPGVPREEKVVVEALDKEIQVVSDITVFLENVSVPVVGITGTNGKSTVTTLMGLVAEEAGIKVSIGGNLGTPALDLLDSDAELFVLELSSFQLESTDNAKLKVAANLNVSQDHIDRHGSLANYFQAKQKIFHGAKAVVYNLHDPLTQPPIVDGVSRYGFGKQRSTETNEAQFYLDEESGYLMKDGVELMHRREMKLKGTHNIENLLAVFAMSDALGIDAKHVEDVAKQFGGLAHRCELVATYDGISYINDSKATNVGAVVSAVTGYASEFRRIVLIMGGVGKGQDFSPLAKALYATDIDVILFGEDAEKIAEALPETVRRENAESLKDALGKARSKLANHAANPELDGEQMDLVLFSPACASFDMFRNFEARGEAFRELVEAFTSPEATPCHS